jgi:DNA-directed RNA polymerase specialized sigma24 family protein
MRIRELLERCSQNDGPAWAQLWQTVHATVEQPLRGLLLAYHLDLSLSDDVLQEFYKYLQKNNLRRLHLFRGDSERAFRAFLRIIAVRFILKLLRKWQRRRQQEDQALRGAARTRSSADRAADEQVRFADFMATLTESDRRKLELVLGGIGGAEHPPSKALPGPHYPSARTVRYWRRELYSKYFGS